MEVWISRHSGTFKLFITDLKPRKIWNLKLPFLLRRGATALYKLVCDAVVACNNQRTLHVVSWARPLPCHVHWKSASPWLFECKFSYQSSWTRYHRSPISIRRRKMCAVVPLEKLWQWKSAVLAKSWDAPSLFRAVAVPTTRLHAESVIASGNRPLINAMNIYAYEIPRPSLSLFRKTKHIALKSPQKISVNTDGERIISRAAWPSRRRMRTIRSLVNMAPGVANIARAKKDVLCVWHKPGSPVDV